MTKKTEDKEPKVETVEVPAPIVQPIAGGCAPADMDKDREEAKQKVRDILDGKDEA